MFCKFCGHEIDDDTVFCPNCGKTPPPLPDTAEPKPVEKPSSGLSFQSHFDAAMGKKTKKTPMTTEKLAVIIISSVAAVVILALLILLLVKSFGSDAPAPTTSGYDNTEEYGHEFENRETTSLTEATTEETTVETTEAVTKPPEGITKDNPYYNVYRTYPAFVLPNSDSSYVCYTHLVNLSPEAFTIAREEIYARHGKTFTDPMLQEYFESRPWYDPRIGSHLNGYETANLDLFRVFEAKRKGTLYQFNNPYLDLTYSDTEYLFETSDIFLIDGSELMYMSAEALLLARNEIFARHGYVFEDPLLREYFYSKEWYVPGFFDETMLTEVEQHNILLIDLYEMIVSEEVYWSSDNRYQDIYLMNQPRSYIISHSSSVYLESRDLIGMSEDELCLARNEIYARNGYTFQEGPLLEYFLHQDWYTPSTPPGDLTYITLSDLERANMDLIKEAEGIAAASTDGIYHGKGPDLSALDTSLTYTIACELYSIRLPAYFRDHGLVKADSSSIRCYEKHSYDVNGGQLFCFYADVYENYSNLDSYHVVGTLTNESTGEQLDVYILYPTSTQYTNEYKDLYNKMSNEIERIIPGITGVNEWVFVPA